MKKLYPLLFVLFFISVGLSEDKVSFENLIKRGSKFYKLNDDKPFTGLVFKFHEKSEVKEFEFQVLDGLVNGIFLGWYENGLKNFEGNMKDGEPDGLHTEWYENGLKKSEKTYNNGEEEGLYTEWYPNGKPYKEKNYKNGNETFYFYDGGKYSESLYKNGLFIITEWYENGPKKFEIITNDVNGQDVSDTWWFKNGQKSLEVLYDKNGKEISRKEWNEDGSVKE